MLVGGLENVEPYRDVDGAAIARDAGGGDHVVLTGGSQALKGSVTGGRKRRCTFGGVAIAQRVQVAHNPAVKVVAAARALLLKCSARHDDQATGGHKLLDRHGWLGDQLYGLGLEVLPASLYADTPFDHLKGRRRNTEEGVVKVDVAGRKAIVRGTKW